MRRPGDSEHHSAEEPVEATAQRTYRYVRIGIILAALSIIVGVTVESFSTGILASLSSYYYTPARTVFTGGLIAIGFALLALAGRGRESVLLNIAAALAPIIALVPTPLRQSDVSQLGLTACPVDPRCIPASAIADARTGLLTYAIVGALFLVMTTIMRAVGELRSRDLALPSVAVGSLIIAGTCAWIFVQPAFLRYAHEAATVGFFLALTTTIVINSARLGRRRSRRDHRFARAYLAIAAVVAVDLALFTFSLFAPSLDTKVPMTLVTEMAALSLFLVYWLLRSVELWHAFDAEPTPPVAARAS